MSKEHAANASQQARKSTLLHLAGSVQKSTDVPIEMLETCHQKVHRMLALLQKLRIYLESTQCDEQARRAALDIKRYFDLAAPLHYQDEELHIFPLLLKHPQPLISDAVHQLLGEHRAMESLWMCIRPDLDRIIQQIGDQPFKFNHAALTAMDRLAAIHGAHIELEETVVYQAAKDQLSPEASQDAMREMMRRRGVR